MASISIATVNGSPYTGQDIHFGDELTFHTDSPKLHGQYPMVVVLAFQDVNQDGTVDTTQSGPDLVYTELAPPSATFKLGGYSSPWMDRGGGAAKCRADLDAYSSHKSEVDVLASVSFEAV